MTDYNINFNDKSIDLVKEIFTNNFGINPEYLKAKNFFNQNNITLHQYEIQQKIKDDKTVLYSYNSDYFRSDEFIKNHKGINILFSGCSETEGVGANIENNWSHMIYQYIKNNNITSGYFNLGLAGNSFDKIINDIINYINNYGNPNIIFILFPNLGRWYEWVDNSLGYQRIGVGPWIGKDLDNDYTTIKTQRDQIIDFTIKIKMLELYCNSNKIDLYWSCWDKYEEKNLNSIYAFNNFIFLDINNFEKELFKKTKNESILKKNPDYFFRRDGHFGQAWNNYFMEKFLIAAKDNKNANIRI